ELLHLKEIPHPDRPSRPIDMALSPDDTRLAIVSSEGLAYYNLTDMARHQLAYNDTRLWLEQVSLTDLIWISDSRLGVAALYLDGQQSWLGWDIVQDKLPVYAKGNHQAAWSTRTGQLAVVSGQFDKV